MNPYELIEGHELVVAHFGIWPSLHDGEVQRIVLDRMSRSESGAYGPTVEVHVRGWIMGPEITDEGSYKLHGDSVISFLFEDIFDFQLEGFNQQNVLSSMIFTFVSDPKSTSKAR